MGSQAIEVAGFPLGVWWTWVLIAFAVGYGVGVLINCARAFVRGWRGR